MINEKTDEEKLRQELEDGLTAKKSAASVPKKKTLKPKNKTISRRQDLTGVIDTFMDDFERRIEDSLNINAASTTHKKSGHQKNTEPLTVKAEPSISELEKLLTPSPLPEEVTIVPEHEVLIEEEAKSAEPETLPEIPEPVLTEPDEPEAAEAVETVETEAVTLPEPAVQESEGLPEIPILEEETPELPDIPVILPDEDDEYDEDLQDILPDGLDEPDAREEQEAQEEQTLPELQETELIEAQEPDDEFADILDDDELDGEAVDEEPATDFSPSADVVVNVDEVIPEIQKDDETQIDPESESVPVTVTMPESTKTAEDKLMADIAEAMTGNPLSLETNDAQSLYNLPENFLHDSDAPSQSAEDKLKANIAQALSESPITTAQSQSQQDLEQEILNPFDEISLPNYEEPVVEDDEDEDEVEDVDEDSETLEPEQEEQEPQEDEQPFDVPVEDVEDVEDEGVEELEEDEKNEKVEELELNDDSPFDVVEDLPPESEPVPEPEPEVTEESNLNLNDELNDEDEDTFSLTDETDEPEPDSDTPQDIDDFADLPFSLGDDDEDDNEANENQQPSVSEPATEQEALSQFVNTNLNEEAITETKMPEESLLDGVETETETENDEWDMSSLGELGQAAVIPDDEPEYEPVAKIPETVTEMITQPETEDDHKEKTMGIREKLALRKNANSDEKSAKKKSSSSSSSSSGGGFFMPLILTLLLIVGALILWQLTQVSNKLTSLALNSQGGFESVSITEAPNPSYDYAIDFILDPNLSERMSQRGRDGWQIVGSRRTQDSTTGQYGYELIFMRRTPGR